MVIFSENSNTAFSNTSNLPTEFQESVLIKPVFIGFLSNMKPKKVFATLQDAYELDSSV